MKHLFRRHRVISWTVLALVVVCVSGGTGYWFVHRTASAEPATTTQTVTAALTTMQQTVSSSGTLAPTVTENVNFAGSGTVTSVNVQAGQTVTAGQALASIDTLQLNADLTSAQSTLAQAKAKLAQDKANSDGTSVATTQIAADKAQVEVAQAAADNAQAAMDGATLTAPVAGLITEVNVEVGQAITGTSSSAGGGNGTGAMGGNGATGSDGSTSSSAQFVITGTDSWSITVSVDDSNVSNIAVGDQAELTVDNVDDTVFGTVQSIGLLPSTSQGVTGYPVTIAVTGSPDGLHDGASADVDIIYERRTDVLAVPTTAVRKQDSTYVVEQPDGSSTKTTTVTIGEQTNGMTEITSGLSEGDEVLVTVVTPQGNSDSRSGTDGQQTFEMPGGMEGGQLPGGQMPGGEMPGGQIPGGQMPGGSNGQ